MPQIDFHNVPPVDVKVRDLSLSITPSPPILEQLHLKRRNAIEPKRILQSVSLDVPSGTLMAIIGASGSGKTSLLNLMAHRMGGGKRIKMDGRIEYNGGPLKDIQHAYVIQQDILLRMLLRDNTNEAALTVRETLKYSAALRLSNTNRKQRSELVEQVIMQLGLKDAANTLVGDEFRRGCSGGEKRRTSIGVQLLANPSVLFLDEPTTGLDAFSALQLIQTLKALAQTGRTIIITIHQPRSDIFFLFDQITLLSEGKTVYTGPVPQSLTYFTDLGYPCPEHVNPADHLIDISTIDTRTSELEDTSSERVHGLISAFKRHQLVSSHGPTEEAQLENPVKDPGVSLWRQVWYLSTRNFRITIRDPFGLGGFLFEGIFIGVIVGWIFYKIPPTLTGIRSMQGFIYTVVGLQGYLLLLFTTWKVCQDMRVYDRERQDKMYSPFAFVLSYRLSHLLTEDIAVPFLFSLITYFMSGYRSGLGPFFVFFAVNLLNHFVNVTFAMWCVSLRRNFAEASLIANASLTFISLSCGFFIQAESMPVYVRWIKYVSYVYWGFAALSSNGITWKGVSNVEFDDNFFDCPYGDATNPSCTPYTGNYILSQLGIPYNYIATGCLALAGFILFYFFTAWIFLRLLPVQLSFTRQIRPKEREQGVMEAVVRAKSTEMKIPTEITIRVNEMRLWIDKQSIIGRTKTHILQGITVGFEPGKLNVIMGPSGSGKTTLLNLLCRRLHGSLMTRYRYSGELLFNDAVPNDQVIRSLTSYVVQDDMALLPSLTVRETLHFAAIIRLPNHMSRPQKLARAEQVLAQLGLRHCADTLIGSELIKGISGGEKRRVSIAIQILTDPKVLVLDEPSSGLDANTAHSLMELLQALAEEGRTVICTIHQSRSDLFPLFGNLLLLARGGRMIYSGKASEMMQYFEEAGYPCPIFANPADFALDLCSVDLQAADREAETKRRVEMLIMHFSASRETPVVLEKQQSKRVTLPAQLGALQRKKTGLFMVFPVLFKRSSLNFRRNPNLVLTRIMQVSCFGIILALFFSRLGNDYVAVQNRVGYIQEITPLLFVGMLNNIAVYPDERNAFYREYGDRAYNVEAFFLSYLALEVPFEIVMSAICTLFLVIPGFPNTVSSFFLVMFEVFCFVNCGESLGIMFCTMFNHNGLSVNFTSIVNSLFISMAGVISVSMPGFLKGLNWISILKWGTGISSNGLCAVLTVSLRNVVFYCKPEQLAADGTCPVTSGEDVLKLYDLDVNTTAYVVGMVACLVIYRILAYGLLRLKLMHWRLRNSNE